MRKLLLLALALVGLFDALYLLWVYTSPSRPMVCLGTGCDVVRASVYSHLWGLPLPLYGVAMYAVLALLVFAEPLASGRFASAARYAVAGISGFGFLFFLYLTYLEAFVIHAWCAWCVVSALAVTAMCALAILEARRTVPPLDPAAALARVREQFVLGVAALLLGTPAFYLLSRHGELPPAPQASTQALLEHLVRPDSHMAGNPQASVTVVEFGDFECAACDRAEEAAREIRAKYGRQIRFVFRQFPLALIHPQAEKAAEASECAAEQGKFWEAVDKLYAGQNDLSEEALKRYAAALGLDMSRFSQCLASGAIAARIRRDLEDGRALGVRATPTFFVGQKMIEGPLPVAQFAQLLDQELASRGVTLAEAVDPGTHAPPPRLPTMPINRRASAGARRATSDAPLAPSGVLGGTSGGIFSKFQTSTTACSEEEAAKQQPTLIRTEEAHKLFEGSPKALFVDVRSPQEYSRGRIPGAISLPVDNLEEQWTTLPKHRTIVLYESGLSPGDVCAASRAAGRILLAHGVGFELVKVYQDGLAGWEKAGFEVER